MPVIKYCTGARELSEGFQEANYVGSNVCQGKMSQVMLKVKMTQPLLASFFFPKLIPYTEAVSW